jgi:hypothetical protein
MRHFQSRLVPWFAILAAVFALSREVFAEEGDRWLLQTSIYTTHFKNDPRHNNNQKLVNVEYQRTDQWIFGAATADSSFDQPIQYIYAGKLWRPIESAPLMHFKLSGGLIHGYKGEFRDKIPFNSSGVAPAILPALGLSGKHVSGEVVLFGVAGVMVTLGVVF